MIERNQAIYERRQSGESYAAIARSEGISRSRAHEIILQVEKQIRYREAYPEVKGEAITLQSHVASVLSIRAANTLRRKHMETLQDVSDLIAKNGLVSTPNDSYVFCKNGKRIYQLGRVAWEQIFVALDNAGFDWKSYVRREDT